MKKSFLLAALVLFPALCFGTYYSKHGQDRIIHLNYFENLRYGTFVDIGSYNGVIDSHSCFFERELGWTGICVEPLPKIFEELKANRTSICVQGCVTNRSGDSQFLKISSPDKNTEMLSGLIDKYEPQHIQRILREMSRFGGSSELIDVKCYQLNDLLEQHQMSHIDLLLIETEGNEFEILASLDFSRFSVDVILVADPYADKRYIPFMATKGYSFVKKFHHRDLLFVSQDFENSISH
ncbi:MAG: FkbM family methyltransferase [Parachlamydia sp.]|nr:FkbM family methyltransferase [Parachlamydia sp.]